MNDHGWVVWGGYADVRVQIFLYHGEKITQLTDGLHGKWFPKINNNGYVVCAGSDGIGEQVFLYNKESIIQLSSIDDGYVGWTLINDEGWVLWGETTHHMDEPSHTTYLYYGHGSIRLDGCTDSDLNNQGNVVCANAINDSLTDIFLYENEGRNTTHLLEAPYEAKYPKINDDGYVVWQGFDGSDWEIFLHDGKKTIQLTHNSHDDHDPQINNDGDVAWVEQDGSKYRIQVSTETLRSNGGGGGGGCFIQTVACGSRNTK